LFDRLGHTLDPACRHFKEKLPVSVTTPSASIWAYVRTGGLQGQMDHSFCTE
jgi:hypothetical protein